MSWPLGTFSGTYMCTVPWGLSTCTHTTCMMPTYTAIGCCTIYASVKSPILLSTILSRQFSLSHCTTHKHKLISFHLRKWKKMVTLGLDVIKGLIDWNNCWHKYAHTCAGCTHTHTHLPHMAACLHSTLLSGPCLSGVNATTYCLPFSYYIRGYKHLCSQDKESRSKVQWAELTVITQVWTRTTLNVSNWLFW